MLSLALALILISAQPGGDGDPDPGYGSELLESAANLDFVIVNRTGQAITELNISPAGEGSWSENILFQNQVPPDERAAASFTRDVELCRWDIRVTYESGSRQSWPRIDLCETVRVELR
jgi:hypothetical protein